MPMTKTQEKALEAFHTPKPNSSVWFQPDAKIINDRFIVLIEHKVAFGQRIALAHVLDSRTLAVRTFKQYTSGPRGDKEYWYADSWDSAEMFANKPYHRLGERARERLITEITRWMELGPDGADDWLNSWS